MNTPKPPMTVLGVIRAIEEFYRFEDIGPVMKWADATHGNAWSNALDKLDRALGVFALEEQKKLDKRTVFLERELQHYLDVILPLMLQHKELKKAQTPNKPTDLRSFLASLRVNP